MQPLNVISLSDYFKASALHTREQAQKVFASIEKALIYTNEEFFVDFSDIEFISRSFADELVNLKNRSEKKNLIQFCCMSSELARMIYTVEQTQNSNKKEKKFPVQRFDNMESLFKFFSAV